MRRYIAVAGLWLSLALAGLHAQNVLFFGSKQGLSNSRVRNIMEDSRHNIWITTQNGLNRYDGVKMNVYRHQIGNPHSLLHDESTCVFEVVPDSLLVGTGAGVQFYDYTTDQFTLIPYVNAEGDTISTRAINIARIQATRLIICFAGYGSGEVRRDGEGRFLVRNSTEFNTGERSWSPVQLLEDTHGKLWVVNAHGELYRRQGRDFVPYPGLADVRRVCLDSEGRLYAITGTNGLYVHDGRADRYVRVASHDQMGGDARSISPWTLGRLLISTDGGGLRVYDSRTGKVTQSGISSKDFDFAHSNVIDAIADSFGNVWAGIYLKGLMMKPINQSAFEYVGPNSITKNSIGQNSVVALAAPPDTAAALWVATDNDGLYRLAPDGLLSTHYTRDSTPGGLPANITALLAPAADTLLVGAYTEGLWLMSGGRATRLDGGINQIFDIRPAARPGTYWVATLGSGLFHYDLAARRARQYAPDYSRPGGTDVLANSYVFCVLPLGRQLWLGTADGLAVAPTGPDGQPAGASTRLLPGHTIRHMAADPDGQSVWVGTNQGLVRVDRRTLSPQRTYTEADGLPNNNIAALAFSPSRHLWVSTDYGLACMDPQAGTFTNFYSDDGLQDNEFSRAATLTLGRHIYMGGISGLTFFNTGRLEAAPDEGRQLHLRMVDAYVGGRTIHRGDRSDGHEMLAGTLDDCGRIDLGHHDNHFTLELHVDGLTTQHVSYEYSLDGTHWHMQDGTGPRLVFDNLPAGTYHIRLRAQAYGNVSPERQLTVVVHPAWWASLWAKAAYALLALLVAWLLWQYASRQVRLRRLMQRSRQQRELNEARVQFFMNISHEIRTPMTLILAPLERLLSSDPDPGRQRSYQLIRQNARRILRLINQMMDVRKIEQGKFLLDRREMELVSFLQGIFDVFATNARDRGISYEFRHPGIERLTVVADPDNTDKIVMNLLSNAFKFTPDGGSVTLTLAPGRGIAAGSGKATPAGEAPDGGQDMFTLTVADTGVGIKDEDKPRVFDRFYSGQHQNGYIGTGIGLHLTAMLVRLHQGDIAVADNPSGQGTLFVVTMPVGDPAEATASAPSAASDTAGQGGTPATPEGNDTAPADGEEDPLLPISRPTDTHRRDCLLVEDDEAIRQYVHSELSDQLVVHPCANGQEAWDYIVAHPGRVDLIISDIMMPVMDGMTLCQRVKANFNTNHIPVILMTALGSDADRIAGISNGADAYLSKPFNIDVLRTTAMQLLRSRQMLQGKYHGERQQEERIDKRDIESPDENLMRRVMKVINDNMDNPELSVELIADKVGISRVHFYRKMKDLTGQAPRDFVKYVRLKEAARLLSEKRLDITGVSIATGFKTLSAFSTSFKALYGMTPSEWVRRAQQDSD